MDKYLEPDEMLEKLKDMGYDTELDGMSIVVSLNNRQLHKSNVQNEVNEVSTGWNAKYHNQNGKNIRLTN